jgi:hypothetical protein
VPTKTIVFDFNDLDVDFTNQALINVYTGPTSAIDHNGYVKRNEFFLANYSTGLRVLDIPNINVANKHKCRNWLFRYKP